METQSPLYQDVAHASARHTPMPLPERALPPPLPPVALPTNSQIEAAIQKAQAMSTSKLDGRSSSMGRDTRTQLFVGNLPYRVRWQDLKDLFRKAGTVLRADVSLGPDNRSRGYGTVLYGNPEDAERAIEMFNAFSWQSRVLEVRPDRLPPPDFDAQFAVAHAMYPVLPSPLHAMQYIPPPPPPGTTLPLAGGAPSIDGFDAALPSPMFLTSSSRGSGSGSGSGRTLFVGNLPFHCQWQDLKDLFRQAGAVLRADVVLGADGRSKGHGTVSFSNDADADNALRMFNGYEFNGRALKVHYDKFTGQHTPMMSASPAPQLQGGMSFIYSALPPYLATQPHPMPMAFEQYIASAPHSPFETSFPQHVMMSPRPQTPPSAGLTVERPARSSSPRSPRNLHIDVSRDREKHGAHHPGPIQLPPPGHVGFAGPPLSPQSASGVGAAPPITPSMPSFSFAPQAQPTPPLHAHFLSPGIGPFSPTLGSGGGFFAAAPAGHPTPGGAAAAGLNPAPGAPVRYTPVMVAHPHPHSPVGGMPPSPGFYVPAYYGPMPGSPGAAGPVDAGYFPPVPPQRQSHPLAQEHTPPTSDPHHTPHAAPAFDYFTPLPPPPPAHDDSPAASVSEDDGSSARLAQSSRGTSLTPSEVEDNGVGKPALRSLSTGTHAAAAAGSRAAFAQAVAAKRAGGAIEEDMAALELEDASPPEPSANGHGHANGTGGRRNSWHVESPSVERGAGNGAAGYFGLR